jgi:hypothetical protein
MTDWKENLFSWSKENEELAFKAFCRFLKERDLSACAEFKEKGDEKNEKI